jgi:hypothetical protein
MTPPSPPGVEPSASSLAHAAKPVSAATRAAAYQGLTFVNFYLNLSGVLPKKTPCTP